MWSGKATLADLSSVLGVEDLHDVLEVSRIDAHNRRMIERAREEGE
jgi:hypothetical protein